MTKEKLKQIYIIFCAFLLLLSILAVSYFLRPHKLKPEDYGKAREVLDFNPTALYKFDPDISYMLKPNFTGIRHDSVNFIHKTNSLSLLGDKEIIHSRNIKKIIFLGDSVAYGDGLPYESIMTTRMQTLAGDAYHLVNGSCPGWSTRQEIIFYKKYLSHIDWDTVVIFFCLNDLIDFEWVYDSETGFKMSADMENIGGLYGAKNKVVESLRLWNMRKNFASDQKTRPLSRHNNTSLFAWEKDKWEKYYNRILLPFFKLDKCPHVIIVALPSKYQIEALKSGAPDKVVLYPQKQLHSYCRASNTAFIDLNGAFIGRNFSPEEFFKDDLHFSARGHEIIAAYLWPALEKIIKK